MKKGSALAVAAIAILSALVLEGIILTNFVYRLETISRALKESEIIKAINAMELTQTSMKYALNYSTVQGFYDVGARGGHNPFETLPPDVKSHDCVPYFWYYSDKMANFPDYERNMRDTVRRYFECYGNSYSSNYPGVAITIPSYSEPNGGITIEDLWEGED